MRGRLADRLPVDVEGYSGSSGAAAVTFRLHCTCNDLCTCNLNASVDAPKYAGSKGGNARLDQCFTLGKNCGQTAANKYCEMFGYQRAKSFTTENASPTQTMFPWSLFSPQLGSSPSQASGYGPLWR